MSSRRGTRLVKWMGWNLKASDAKKAAPIRLGIRRVRQVALLLRARPEVFIAVEVGSPNQALSLSKMLSRAGSPLRRVPNGGAWRYIWVNPKVVKVIKSGLRSMKHRYQGDDKPIAWAVATVRGRRSIFVGAHLENIGPLTIKIAQADDVLDLIRELMDDHDVEWKDVYLYVDTNDPTGQVQKHIESGALSSVNRLAAKTTGTEWASHNGWKRRTGAGRKGISIDGMYAGQYRDHSTVIQYDTHTSSDHDAKVATAIFV